MMGNELEPVLRSAIDRFISETNDTNAEYIALPDTTWETMGAHSHPGFFSHLATAKLLEAHLAEHFHLEAKYDILL